MTNKTKVVREVEEAEQTFEPTESVNHSDFKITDIKSPVKDTTESKEIAEIKDNIFDDDFESARKNIRKIVEKGGDALDDLIFIARSLESPRAFEVVAEMMKQLTNSNKELIDLYKNKKEQQEEKEKPAQYTQNNSTIYVGSTMDLQRQLKNDE